MTIIPPDRLARGLYWSRALSLVSGCTYCSPGCANCWSAAEASVKGRQANPKIRAMYGGLTEGQRWNGEVRVNEHLLDLPLRTKTPQVWSVWTDLFHPSVSYEFQRKAFGYMHSAPRHTFLVLTKRPERLRAFVVQYAEWCGFDAWPREYGHVWLGTTAENQEQAGKRIPELLATPAAHRWVSVEPMLSAVNLRPYLQGQPRLDAVIAGGESGKNARPVYPHWARSLRDQCAEAGVPFVWKSWGEWAPSNEPGLLVSRVGKRAAGRLIDGVEHFDLPWSAA